MMSVAASPSQGGEYFVDHGTGYTQVHDLGMWSRVLATTQAVPAHRLKFLPQDKLFGT